MRTLDEILGPLDPVWDESEPRTKLLTDRPGGEIFLVGHHSVSRTLQSIEDTFKSPYRSVSATSGVGPLTAGADDYRVKQYVPWNSRRPYTTSSWVDDRAITFEMANLLLAAPWPVGQTGKRWLAELIAAMHVELGMPIDRWHVTCHREIYERGWESYATACPGDDLHAALDWGCGEAKRIVAGAPALYEGDDDMRIIQFKTGLKVDGRGLGDSVWVVAPKSIQMLTSGQWNEGGQALADMYGGLRVAGDAAMSRVLDVNGIPWTALEAAFRKPGTIVSTAPSGVVDPSVVKAVIAEALAGARVVAEVSDEKVAQIGDAAASAIKERL